MPFFALLEIAVILFDCKSVTIAVLGGIIPRGGNFCGIRNSDTLIAIQVCTYVAGISGAADLVFVAYRKIS